MKKSLLMFLLLILVCGCSNINETEKDNYISLKKKIVNISEFTNIEEINFNIDYFVVKDDDGEKYQYSVVITPDSDDMYDVRAILVHNQMETDIFPSVGIFTEPYDLIVDDADVRGLSLEGEIETEKEFKDLDLELRLLVQYNDANGDFHEISYHMTKFE